MPLKRIAPKTYRLKSLHTRLRRQEGAALVEFALSLGIFLAVTIGIVYVCLALFTYEYVDFAARETARWAAVRGADCYLSSQNMPGCTTAAGATPTDIQNHVKNLGYPIVNPNNLNVSVSWLSKSADANNNAIWVACTPPSPLPAQGNGCNDPGDAVRVTITDPNYGLAIPFMGNHVIQIGSTVQMVISQ